MRQKAPSKRLVAALAIVLVVAGFLTLLVVFAYFGQITRGAQLNAWPESRIVYPGARLVATETKDLAPQSWVEDDTAELIRTYEVDVSVLKSSIVAYYSRRLSELGWTADTADTTVTAPDAGFCKPPNQAAFITFGGAQSFTYTLKHIALTPRHQLVCRP